MKYLRGTREMPLVLTADRSGILKWWVDASFVVHPNMRGHSGGGLSLDKGFPIVSSTKQKLNTRSSMETETVGADDFMPMICWTLQFMESSRLPSPGQCFVPGQQERNSFGEEWKGFKQQAHDLSAMTINYEALCFGNSET